MSNKVNGATPCAIVEILLSVGVLTALYVAITMDGSWTLGNNHLYELGMSKNATVVAIFKWTCIVGGILALIAAVSRVIYRKGYGKASAFFYAVFAIVAICMGLVLSKENIVSHLVSVLFLLFLVALAISAIDDSYSNRKITAACSLVLFMVIIAAAFGFNSMTLGVITTVCMCAWIFTQGLSLAFRETE